MAANATKLMKNATTYAAKGKHQKALECYQKLIQLNPKDMKIWVKTGDMLKKLGRTDEAVEFYTKAAANYALNGFLMQAISVNKMILEIDPEHSETQEALAELYSRREGELPPPRVDKKRKSMPAAAETGTGAETTSKSDDKPVASIKLRQVGKPKFEVVEKVRQKPQLEEATLISEVLEEEFEKTSTANATSGDLVSKLPDFPLFSAIDADTFAAMISNIDLHRFDQGDTIVEEGDIGSAFYVIAEGEAAIWKKDAKGESLHVGALKEGDFFGEFGTLTATPRAVSVIADTDMLVLEIDQAALNNLMLQYEDLEEALDEFYRKRLVGTILQTSPIFQPLAEAEREQILKFFAHNVYGEQEELIVQGETGKYLTVIISGQIAVTVKDHDGNEVMVAILREGDFMGEISLLTGKPTTATCTAINETHVYELEGNVFKELLNQFPIIKDTVKQVAKDRIENLRSGYMAQEEPYKAGLV